MWSAPGDVAPEALGLLHGDDGDLANVSIILV